MVLDSSPAGMVGDHEMGVGESGSVDTMILDSSHAGVPGQTRATMKDHEKGVKQPLKRKRASVDGNVISQDKGSLVADCRRELDDMFGFYKEVSGYKLHLEESARSLNNSVIACLLEESNLPFSKLVEDIYETLKVREGVNLASVRSAVLSVGQRAMYGIANPDADVLEDESESCLWCWETRDMKLLPMIQRGILNIRRMARKRIHKRVSALSEMLSALSVPESHETYNSDLMKASVKLGKALNREGIRSLIEKLKQKNDADIAVKEAKLKVKELTKEVERNKRNAEKEKKRMDRELQKEKCQSEKELKRLQEEAEKEDRRHEKEEAELKKQLKKQQEEAERDQRRREKEEAELKKQLAIRKQATIMERFLKSKKSNNSSDKSEQGSSSSKSQFSDSLCKKEDMVNATTSSMDCTFSKQDNLTTEDLRKSHVDGWHKLSRCNRSCHWGVRRNPKIELIKELKIQRSSSEAEPPEKVTTLNRGPATSQVNSNIEPSFDKLVDGLEACFVSSHNNLETAYPSVPLLKKKLLQFDKSHRPAYYGTWRKKSGEVGPRHPFKKDPDLDYDVDSDEEWEEEDPGESLSDCDKDNEERLEEENLKIEDEDESEDSFVVPDGYLSENEGIQVNSSSEGIEDDARSSPCCNPEVESEEFKALLQQQKHLHSLTEQALEKGRPLVISNLMHEKAGLMMAEELNGTPKLEQLCLQALCMRACPGGSVIDISINDNPSNEDQDICQSQNRNSTTPTATAAGILDSDLPEFVRSIRSNPHGINRIVESLQRKFPATSKSQLRNKVREISDFVDNRWQVKKEILNRLGLSNSPDKGAKPKGIMTYFSKRCLPPEEESNISESSPPTCSKTKVLHGDDGQNTQTDV